MKWNSIAWILIQPLICNKQSKFPDKFTDPEILMYNIILFTGTFIAISVAEDGIKTSTMITDQSAYLDTNFFLNKWLLRKNRILIYKKLKIEYFILQNLYWQVLKIYGEIESGWQS